MNELAKRSPEWLRRSIRRRRVASVSATSHREVRRLHHLPRGTWLHGERVIALTFDDGRTHRPGLEDEGRGTDLAVVEDRWCPVALDPRCPPSDVALPLAAGKGGSARPHLQAEHDIVTNQVAADLELIERGGLPQPDDRGSERELELLLVCREADVDGTIGEALGLDPVFVGILQRSTDAPDPSQRRGLVPDDALRVGQGSESGGHRLRGHVTPGWWSGARPLPARSLAAAG